MICPEAVTLYFFDRRLVIFNKIDMKMLLRRSKTKRNGLARRTHIETRDDLSWNPISPYRGNPSSKADFTYIPPARALAKTLWSRQQLFQCNARQGAAHKG